MKAKKSLGQNFLTSQKIVGEIVSAANISDEDTIVEIGPGKGVLTKALLRRAGHVIAIEKDHDLIPLLQEIFSEEIASKKLTLIEGDALSFHDLPKEYKLVANIPYYITGMILESFLSRDEQPTTMVLMVQKEVADRIARADKGSILSMSVHAYGEPTYITTVSRRLFSPSPEVDSAVIAIENISRKNFKNKKQEEQFFTLLKTGFGQKRKVLMKNLRSVAEEKKIESAFTKCNINEKSRAENLSRDDWLCLTQSL